MYIYTWVNCKFFFHPHPKPASCHFGRPIKANMFGSHLHPFKEFLCILWPTLVLEDERRWHEGGTTHQRPKRINMKPEGHTPSPPGEIPGKNLCHLRWNTIFVGTKHWGIQRIQPETQGIRGPNHLVDLDKAFGFCISSAASNTGVGKKWEKQILQGLNHLLLPHGLSLQVGVLETYDMSAIAICPLRLQLPRFLSRWPTSEGNKNILPPQSFHIPSLQWWCCTHPLFVTRSCLSWPQLATQRARGPKDAKGCAQKAPPQKQRRHLSLSQFLAITCRSKTSRYVDFMASFMHIQVTNSRYIRQHT